MKLYIFIALSLLTFCGEHSNARADDLDNAISNLVQKLIVPISDHNTKKIAVIDFTDLHGASNELGRYIGEQLSMEFIMAKKSFAVLNRGNLKVILDEHKLTATGLVNPDDAKKLGMFAGVDAFVLGTIIPKNQTVLLNAKVLTTDTAEIIGAARVEFKAEDVPVQVPVQPALTAKPADKVPSEKDNPQTAEKPKIVKSFGDFRVELSPLQILKSDFQLTMEISNPTSKSLWFAISYELGGNYLKGFISDSEGNEFKALWNDLSGVEYAWNNGGFERATEIKPGGSITATAKFASSSFKRAAPGTCRLQLELLSAQFFRGDRKNPAIVHNLVTKLEAE